MINQFGSCGPGNRGPRSHECGLWTEGGSRELLGKSTH